MRGLLFLLSALFLLESTDGHTEYEQLSQHDREIVDKAITQANEDFRLTQHLDYAFILKANREKRMLNVILQPTSCDNTTPSVHKENCTIQGQAKPQVSCVECRGSMACFRLRHKKKIEQTISECLNPPPPVKTHLTGGNTLFRQSENQQQTGCLGCI